jgi:hypothetical protein
MIWLTRLRDTIESAPMPSPEIARDAVLMASGYEDGAHWHVYMHLTRWFVVMTPDIGTPTAHELTKDSRVRKALSHFTGRELSETAKDYLYDRLRPQDGAQRRMMDEPLKPAAYHGGGLNKAQGSLF